MTVEGWQRRTVCSSVVTSAVTVTHVQDTMEECLSINTNITDPRKSQAVDTTVLDKRRTLPGATPLPYY